LCLKGPPLSRAGGSPFRAILSFLPQHSTSSGKVYSLTKVLEISGPLLNSLPISNFPRNKLATEHIDCRALPFLTIPLFGEQGGISRLGKALYLFLTWVISSMGINLRKARSPKNGEEATLSNSGASQGRSAFLGLKQFPNFKTLGVSCWSFPPQGNGPWSGLPHKAPKGSYRGVAFNERAISL